jgi:small redox-active disulfide protein 2
MTIKILGPGCANCKTLLRRTEEVLRELGKDATIEKVEDFQTIAAYGILRTPGLVIDETVVASGSVPPREKIKELLLTHLSPA